MAKFQIVSPHDEAECVRALDDMLAHDPEFQSEVWFGCHVGDHTGYALVEASNSVEAKDRLPKSLQPRSRVVEVEHFTAEEIKGSHESVV